jgi:hypothetical protein
LAKHGKQPLPDTNIEAQPVRDDELHHRFNFFSNSPDEALQKVLQQLSDAVPNVCIRGINTNVYSFFATNLFSVLISLSGVRLLSLLGNYMIRKLKVITLMHQQH